MEVITERLNGPGRLHSLTGPLSDREGRFTDRWLAFVESREAGGAAGVADKQPAAPPDPILLSSSQISPQREKRERKKQSEIDGPRVSWSRNGRYARVVIPGAPPPGPCGKREKISGFSSKSRRALLVVVNSINQRATEPGHFAFATLTYPKEFPTASASKRDLDTFIKRFERAWGKLGLIWKLEPQKRGAPHFHLLVHLGKTFDPKELTEWTALAWHEIAGQGDPNHLMWHRGMLGNRMCVEAVNDWQGVALYAGKYLGKISHGDEEWQHPGRFWGVRSRELLPIEMAEEAVSGTEARLVRRLGVRYCESQFSGWWYLPGKRKLSGADRPGRKIHGNELYDLGQGKKPFRECWQQVGEMLGVEPRRLKRRWPRSKGGWAGFMPSAVFERMLTWAKQAAQEKRLRSREHVEGGWPLEAIEL